MKESAEIGPCHVCIEVYVLNLGHARSGMQSCYREIVPKDLAKTETPLCIAMSLLPLLDHNSTSLELSHVP